MTARRAGWSPGDFVFLEFCLADEEDGNEISSRVAAFSLPRLGEAVNMISVDTEGQTFTAIVNKNQPAGSTIRPSGRPPCCLRGTSVRSRRWRLWRWL